MFEPGTQFSYSNTNYQVAAMALQRVTGTSLADLLRARIVKPLGLVRTSIAPPDTDSPELRGYGTSASDGSLVDLADDLGWFGNGGNGGIISTGDELLTVIQAIAGGRYLREDLTEAMLTPNKGTYGLGIGTYNLSCGHAFGHQGGVNGTASIAVASRDGRDGVVIAFNLRARPDPALACLADDLLLSGAGMTSLNDASRSTARSRCCSSGGGAGGRQSGRAPALDPGARRWQTLACARLRAVRSQSQRSPSWMESIDAPVHG